MGFPEGSGKTYYARVYSACCQVATDFHGFILFEKNMRL